MLETVGADKIRVRVLKIPKLNTYADVRLNYELLKNMGFTEIEIFDYIEINKHKRISDVALKNKNDFVDVANNNFIKDKISQQLQLLRDKGIIEFVGRGNYKKVNYGNI